MADLFDPADFSSPPSASDPGADYRTLLDAIRRAGAEGVGEATQRILAAIQQDADAREKWNSATTPALSAIQKAAEDARASAEAARQAGDWMGRRAIMLAIGAALLVAGTAWASLAWQRGEVADLKAQRASLSAEIDADQARLDRLKLRGADLDWSNCTVSGMIHDTKRRCIKVAHDADTPTGPTPYGNGIPHYVIPEGY